jgi:LmbE family N-acetylglucosaminyl deacetylase
MTSNLEHESGQERPGRILIVGAHPDDPDAFCGGSVAAWADAGAEIWYVVVTSGDKGVPDAESEVSTFTETREQEQLSSAEYLGAQGVTFLRYVDGEVFDSLELRERITLEIRRFKPDLILTHDPLTRQYRQHPDHRAVGFAAIHSAFPTSHLTTFFPHHAEEGFEPHVTKQMMLFGSDQPDTFVDIGATFERKIEALEMHVSQEAAFHGALRERMRTRAEAAGNQSGQYELAEAFLFVDLG